MNGPATTDTCAEGVCGERLCGRMKRELHFFSFLAESDLDEIAPYFECRQVPAGKALWAEGDEGNYVAFIISGKVEVNKQTEFAGKPVVIAVYSRGTIVGELNILDGTPRSVGAIALEPADLILLNAPNFHRLLENHPQLGVKLLQGMLLTVSMRLRKSFERLASIF